MAKLGSIDVFFGGGIPAVLDVFDDGLVVVRGSKAASAGMAFGALGALIGGAAARRGLAKRREELDALQPQSAAAAGSVDGVEVVPAGDVTAVRIKKSLIGAGRRVTIERSSGGKIQCAYASKKVPTATVVGLLQPVLGGRLEVAEGA